MGGGWYETKDEYVFVESMILVVLIAGAILFEGQLACVVCIACCDVARAARLLFLKGC